MTFPILLQNQWEVSRAYGMFATPIAYRVDEEGVIAAGVATGKDRILELLASVTPSNGKARERRCACGKPVGECGCGRRVAAPRR